jgi:hypothetical protein
MLCRLKKGCQWRQWPVKHFFEQESLTWQGMYYYFNRWSKPGYWLGITPAWTSRVPNWMGAIHRPGTEEKP